MAVSNHKKRATCTRVLRFVGMWQTALHCVLPAWNRSPAADSSAISCCAFFCVLCTIVYRFFWFSRALTWCQEISHFYVNVVSVSQEWLGDLPSPSVFPLLPVSTVTFPLQCPTGQVRKQRLCQLLSELRRPSPHVWNLSHPKTL